jgi:uncharacterized protein (DUF58 family)
MRPAPALLERLRSLRLTPNRARPSQGAGERRSAVRGAGLEFMDHRPYRQGDDVRNLDPRLLARFGEPFIRQYAADQKLPVTIVVDTSASMRAGSGDKLKRAVELAQLLGFVALAQNDAVRICRMEGGRLDWSPRLSGTQRADMLFAWLAHPVPAPSITYGKLLVRALETLPASGLVVLVSDWLDADAENSLLALQQTGQEPVIVQICDPAEIDPEILGSGGMTLVDAETGGIVSLELDAVTLARYRQAFEAHRAQLRQAARRAQGWYAFLDSSESAARLLFEDLRRAGLVASY